MTINVVGLWMFQYILFFYICAPTSKQYPHVAFFFFSPPSWLLDYIVTDIAKNVVLFGDLSSKFIVLKIVRVSSIK